LNASDVGALSDDTQIPSKTSDLTNDSGFVNAQQAAASAPVQSVNGQTGAVTIPIPTVPQMATQADMSDWTSGKTVDAATLKTDFNLALLDLDDLHVNKADKTEIPDASASAPVMDGTAAVGTSTDYARADHVHPSDTTRLATTGNAYRSASIPMGHLDATSTATVMTATVDGITELRNGVCMWLQNGKVTSASGFTINVNGLGAKPCYSSLAAASRSTTIFNVNYTLLFVYNEDRVEDGCWDIVYGVDTNTTYTPPKLGFGYGTCTTAAATAAKTASISSYALTTGGIVSIKFENDVPAGATLNISSKGAKAIYHRGAAITADVIKGGDTATFIYSTYYHLIAIDRDETADLTNYQTKAITDTGGYYSTDTVEGALQEIGAELAGVNTLIGSGVIS
jgi:hypothetical protein